MSLVDIVKSRTVTIVLSVLALAAVVDTATSYYGGPTRQIQTRIDRGVKNPLNYFVSGPESVIAYPLPNGTQEMKISGARKGVYVVYSTEEQGLRNEGEGTLATIASTSDFPDLQALRGGDGVIWTQQERTGIFRKPLNDLGILPDKLTWHYLGSAAHVLSKGDG